MRTTKIMLAVVAVCVLLVTGANIGRIEAEKRAVREMRIYVYEDIVEMQYKGKTYVYTIPYENDEVSEPCELIYEERY